jgi:hypothetical protein
MVLLEKSAPVNYIKESVVGGKSKHHPVSMDAVIFMGGILFWNINFINNM